MKINRLLVLLTPVMILSLLLAGCGAGGESGQATPTPYPTPVRTTYSVQRGDIVIDARLQGRITPIALQTVSFPMAGHVSEVFVQVSDTVVKGQLLAQLTEMKDIQKQVNDATRAIRRAQIDLEIAQLTLEKYKAENRPAYDIQIQELQVELAQIALNEVYQGLGLDPATTTLDDLSAMITKAQIFAPADGTVITSVTPGRQVSTTTVAFVIGDPTQLETIVQINANNGEKELKDLFEGMTVIVTVNTRPNKELRGTIRQLPSPYGTGSKDDMNIHIVLDDVPSADTYQSGDQVTVTIQLANKVGVLWLPPEAIHQTGGRTFVIVNGDNGPQRIEIEIGLQTLDKIEIISGLAEGQVVIGP
jgi:RND family efflux transporter MFP subunit